MNGYFLIDKESGYTSNDVDCIIRKKFHLRKAGHLGTLDPFATGLLIVGFNDATRLMSVFEDKEKTYVATLCLGKTTDTLDCDGTVTETREVKPYGVEEIQAVLHSFFGKQKQEVPLYSAKHINGKRAYELARENKEVVAPVIDIEIKDIRLLSYKDNEITFETTVSKGTYIRSIGRDIAKRLNTIGYLTSLRRTRVNQFDVKDAKKIQEIALEDVMSIQEAFPEIKIHACDEVQSKRVFNGNDLNLNFENDAYLFMESHGQLLALYRKDREHHYISYRGFSREQD